MLRSRQARVAPRMLQISDDSSCLLPPASGYQTPITALAFETIALPSHSLHPLMLGGICDGKLSRSWKSTTPRRFEGSLMQCPHFPIA